MIKTITLFSELNKRGHHLSIDRSMEGKRDVANQHCRRIIPFHFRFVTQPEKDARQFSAGEQRLPLRVLLMSRLQCFHRYCIRLFVQPCCWSMHVSARRHWMNQLYVRRTLCLTRIHRPNNDCRSKRTFPAAFGILEN